MTSVSISPMTVKNMIDSRKEEREKDLKKVQESKEKIREYWYDLYGKTTLKK